METTDTHLELEERCRLRGLMEMGLGISKIARRLDCHRATIHPPSLTHHVPPPPTNQRRANLLAIQSRTRGVAAP